MVVKTIKNAQVVTPKVTETAKPSGPRIEYQKGPVANFPDTFSPVDTTASKLVEAKSRRLTQSVVARACEGSQNIAAKTPEDMANAICEKYLKCPQSERAGLDMHDICLLLGDAFLNLG